MDDGNKKVINPLRFKEEDSGNPLVFLNSNINNKDNYAILATTDNGKWVRGEYLYYKFNGVEIFTDINNIIFVNKKTKTLFIRSDDRIVKNIAETSKDNDKENQQYIILYTWLGYEDSEDQGPENGCVWEAVSGRLDAYYNIQSYAPVVDIDKSIVLVDNVPMKDALSIREFVNYVQNANLVEDDDFDINQYNPDYV